jgi:hypothetical protein
MATANSIEYRLIPDWPGYRVGSDGSVWTAWSRYHRERRMDDRWRPLKARQAGVGYWQVTLTRGDGTRNRHFYIHRLVLLVFVGPCPDGMQCRHLNGDRTDNRLENLAWGTAKENAADRRDMQTQPAGENHWWAKLTENQVREIRRRYAAGGITQTKLGEEYGICIESVSLIVRRINWKHIV